MSDNRSREALYEFLDYLANKGLMAKATVSARKASAGKVLGILTPEEATDVTSLNLSDVMRRFQNLEGKKYTPGSLNTYQSRTKTAIEDFEVYLKNPMGFRPSAQPRERTSKNDQGKIASASEGAKPPEPQPIRQSTLLSASIFPIPIRPDVTVHIQGLPYDLTESEANKIANVIRAMATSV
jgi:hypothetical protein